MNNAISYKELNKVTAAALQELVAHASKYPNLAEYDYQEASGVMAL